MAAADGRGNGNQRPDKVPVTFKLDADLKRLALQVARVKGIDLSEHVRSLVIEDLDRRGLLLSRMQRITGR